MVRRLFSISIAVAVMIILFSGCKKSEQSDEMTSDISFSFEKVTLQFYFSGVRNKNATNVLQEIEYACREQLNIELDFNWIDEKQYPDNIKRLLMSNDKFDAFIANATFPQWSYDIASENIELEEILLDITEMFPRYAPDFYQKFTTQELMEASYNGKLMAIPHNLPGSYRRCVVVREDLMEKHNIPEIDTYEDYEVYLKTIKDNEQNIVPGFYSTWTIYDFAEYFGYVPITNDYIYFVYRWDDPSMKLIPWEQTDAYRSSIMMVERWFEEDYIVSQSGRNGVEHDFVYGKVGSFINYWDRVWLYEHTIDSENTAKVYPLHKEKQSRQSPVTNPAVVFNKNAENPERAIAFIEWVNNSQENYDLFMHGIENKNYTCKEEQLVLPEDDSLYYGWDGCKAFQNIEYLRGTITDPKNFKELYLESTGLNISPAPHTGFIPDMKELTSFIEQREKGYIEMERLIHDGNFNKSVDEFIDEQKEMGVKQALDLLQSQLDKWRNNN